MKKLLSDESKNFTHKNIFCEFSPETAPEGFSFVIDTPDIERYAHDKEEAIFIINDFLENYQVNDHELVPF